MTIPTVLLIIGIYILFITVVQIGLILKGNRDIKTMKDDYDWNPSVSIILPAYNEEASIVSSVRGALGQTYDNFDVIVVNDGSTDNTSQIIIDAFGLKPFSVDEEKSIYKNGILTLIEKENGGKFDALNVGIDHSTADRVLGVDADSLIVPETLQTIVRYTNPESTASTAAIGMINGCEVSGNGCLTKRKLSFNPLVVSQTIEYLRTFLMLKLSLNKNNGIMVLSGACSFFDREFVQKIGGYRDRLTEDADITLRIHLAGGTVQFIPKVLSYTECPSNFKMLRRQRYRWIRGIIRDAWDSRKLLKEKTAIGRFMLPYFYITDLVFPWIEFLGWALFIWTIFYGTFSLPMFLLFLAFVILMYIVNNMVLLWAASKHLKVLDNLENRWYLFFIAMVDYIYYRPIMVYMVLTSQIKEVFKASSPWGRQDRSGF